MLNWIKCGWLLRNRKAWSTEFLTEWMNRTRHFECSEDKCQVPLPFHSSVQMCAFNVISLYQGTFFSEVMPLPIQYEKFSVGLIGLFSCCTEFSVLRIPKILMCILVMKIYMTAAEHNIAHMLGCSTHTHTMQS